MDREIARLASQQHGVVGRAQLDAIGLSRGAIEGRLARGQLHQVYRGAYAVGHPLLSTHGRWMAAVLALDSEAVLSHRSAGALWSLLPRFPSAVEVTTALKRRPRRGMVSRRAVIPADERTELEGIPVTCLTRTLLDLAVVLDRRALERAMNEADVRRLTDRLSLPTLLERYPRRRGSAVLRDLLRDETAIRGITRSALEERFAELVAAAALPRPQLNAPIAVGNRFFEVDCLWRGARVVVELDGHAAHGTSRAFEKDRERDRLLIADGWRVLRLTWRQLRDDAPAAVADLRSLLASSGAPTL